jgi:tetratricopeptide (TPR) repeat protein
VLASALDRSPSRRGLALGVCLALAVPTGLASSPRVAQAAVTAPDEDPALAESRALYEEGKAKFDTFDFEGAVDLWTKAYAKLPDSETGVRNAMVYNIATAQEKAYELDKDVQHLRQAVLLLEQYIKSYKVLHVRTPETKAEVQRAQERIAALQERIERAERGEPEPSAAPDQPATAPSEAHYGTGQIDGIVWTPVASGPPDADKLHRNRRLATADKKTDNMLIGSYVALSVGGLLAVAGTGAVLGTQDAGQGAQGAGYGTLALGLAGLTTGVALLVVGLERRKKARQGTLVAATPVVGPRFAGAAVSMRF